MFKAQFLGCFFTQFDCVAVVSVDINLIPVVDESGIQEIAQMFVEDINENAVLGKVHHD